jgi:hypothetical protein
VAPPAIAEGLISLTGIEPGADVDIAFPPELEGKVRVQIGVGGSGEQ